MKKLYSHDGYEKTFESKEKVQKDRETKENVKKMKF